MSHIISVTNQKGGVGKTTSTVNIASSLSSLGYKVLIVDLDPQGHSSQHVNVFSHSDTGVLGVLQHKSNLLDALKPTYLPNLWILPSNLKLGQFNQLNSTGKQFILKESLSQEAKKHFDFVLIDCQPSLSLLTLNALTSCDQVLLPVQAEFLALDGLSQLILSFKEVQAKLHPRLKVLGILLTMFDNRNRLSFEVQNELKKNFGKELFDTVIPRNVKLAEAPSFGKTIFEYDNNCSGAVAYKKLAKEILEKIKTKE